jgi:hypothetical protein
MMGPDACLSEPVELAGPGFAATMSTGSRNLG